MSNRLPEIVSYGRYSSDNHGAHTLRIDVGPLTVWFSYKTPVAFQVRGGRRVVRRNDWGVTTGKHLNWIDGGAAAARLTSEEFERRWEAEAVPLMKG